MKTKLNTLLLLLLFLSGGLFMDPFQWHSIAYGKETVKKDTKKRVKKFALNFNDVEISEFLHIMSRLTGRNIVMDDKVRGKISISSSKKVPVSEALNIMKSVLELKGFAVVDKGDLLKVIPMKDAIRKNVDIVVDGKIIPKEGVHTVTFLLELTVAEASEVSRALLPIKSKYTDIVVYEPLNTIILSGSSSEVQGLIKIARALDRQAKDVNEKRVSTTGNIHVLHLENADAVKLGEVLGRIPFADYARIKTGTTTRNVRKSSKARRVTRNVVSRRNKQRLSIVANKETNSLIITASPNEFREIRNVIKELDIVREQVLIEALILEVNVESGWGFGIDWMLGNQTGSALYGGSSVNNGVPSLSTPNGLSSKTLALPLSTGFQLGFLSDSSILSYAVLNASGEDSNFNILSTPQILTIDNYEAELNVGEEIPVPTNNRISDSGTQFYTYDYKSVGVKLKITPHITQKKLITLDMYQEVNSVLGETTVTGSTIIPPTLGKRDIKTRVTVEDGKTIVVGGLITNNKMVEESGLPVLKDIPLLGWLFKRKTVSYKKTNLLIFITPTIVTRQKKLQRITKQKRDAINRLRHKE